ncbi:MAG: CPBP family intramembrane glutamic endopeptidase [Oscillospiraceae bacterium]
MDEILKNRSEVSINKKLIILAAVMAAVVCVTFGGRMLAAIEDIWLRRFLNCLQYAVMAVPAVVGMKLSGMSIKKQLDFANVRQYLWALVIFAALSLTIAIIPALFGISFIGDHAEPPATVIAYAALYYIGFVGAVEELIFRGYIQELLVDILPRHKWLGAVIAAALFGLWHWINGSFVQVLFTFAIGAFIGLMKYFIKNCTLISAALGHGLYDFMNIIIRIVLIK